MSNWRIQNPDSVMLSDTQYHKIFSDMTLLISTLFHINFCIKQYFVNSTCDVFKCTLRDGPWIYLYLMECILAKREYKIQQNQDLVQYAQNFPSISRPLVGMCVKSFLPNIVIVPWVNHVQEMEKRIVCLICQNRNSRARRSDLPKVNRVSLRLDQPHLPRLMIIELKCHYLVHTNQSQGCR